jgi:hypothetical protein
VSGLRGLRATSAEAPNLARGMVKIHLKIAGGPAVAEPPSRSGGSPPNDKRPPKLLFRRQNANVARTRTLGQYHVESFAAKYAQLDLIVDSKTNTGKRRMRRRHVHFAAYAIGLLDN